MPGDATDKVTVYGADWCGVTRATRAHLDRVGVAYRYVDVDGDPQASEWVKAHNGGNEVKPTLDVEGEVVTAPRDAELDDVLRRHQILA